MPLWAQMPLTCTLAVKCTMDAIRLLRWLAPAVLFGCCAGLWLLEQVLFPESNGALGGLVGLILGGLGAQLAEHIIGRVPGVWRRM